VEVVAIARLADSDESEGDGGPNGNGSNGDGQDVGEEEPGGDSV
jgi:hypothetical protein